MSIFREIPPTAGFTLQIKELFLSLKADNRDDLLEEDFRRFLDASYVRITCSGTASFYLILESLKKISTKKTIIIPSYICPLIPLAIKRAGLKIAVCDIRKSDFNFSSSMLEKLCSFNRDILAIVAVHLAGIPLEFDAIDDVAKKYGIFTIEDCAQSLGAVYKGKKAGTLGDFSFFSMCRGKGITIYEGGAVVANRKEHSTLIDETIESLVKIDSISEALLVIKMIGYWIFYRPSLFWLVFRLPQIFWNWRGNKVKALSEYFTINFPLHRVSKARRAIGHSQFNRLENEIRKQREKASYYIERLENIKGVNVIRELPETMAVYPFVTLIFDDKGKKKKALESLESSGFGVSEIYACSISDYYYLKEIIPDSNCSNARYLTDREITLSTSTFLKKKDLDMVVNILADL